MSGSMFLKHPLAVATAVAALAVAGFGGYWALGGKDKPAAAVAAPAAPWSAAVARLVDAARESPPAAASATGSAAPALQAAPAVVPMSPQAVASQQAFERLRGMPSGDAAVELTRQLEAGLTPENAPAYVQALLQTNHPAVERAAISAIAQHGDGALLQALAGSYGKLGEEQRGRILRVLESAANPQALDGLSDIVAADQSEKRSPVMMSAMYGMAHMGTPESVGKLLSLVTVRDADYALMALERVRNPQGVEMIRAASEGSKDAEGIPPQYWPSLKRIAQNARSS